MEPNKPFTELHHLEGQLRVPWEIFGVSRHKERAREIERERESEGERERTLLNYIS